MSVQSNITRIEGGKASLKTSINNKLTSSQTKITNEHIEDYYSFVDAIETGGGHGTIVPLSVTANGTYTASGSTDGYSPITVNVPQTGQILPAGWIMQQGEFTVDEDTECWYDTTNSVDHRYTLNFDTQFPAIPQIFLVKMKNKLPMPIEDFPDRQFISANKQYMYSNSGSQTSFTDSRYSYGNSTISNSNNYNCVTTSRNSVSFGAANTAATGPVKMPAGYTYVWVALYIPYLEAIHCTSITLDQHTLTLDEPS